MFSLKNSNKMMLKFSGRNAGVFGWVFGLFFMGENDFIKFLEIKNACTHGAG
jgi:hypothetical protein